MSGNSIWMVRAGRGGAFVDDFIEQGLVSIGFDSAGRVEPGTVREQIESTMAAAHPDESKRTITVWAAQVKRYYDEIKVGDEIATYDPNQRLYYLGKILSDVEYREDPVRRVRRVEWTKKVPRDALQDSTRNTLGAISTLFLIKQDAARDMHSAAIPISAEPVEPKLSPPVKPKGETKARLEEAIEKSAEFIEDRIAALDWDEMQELVSEILKAMGYRTRVSPKGADRGVDVFASPDGLGLQEPRIFVEVKHRPGTQIGAQSIRAFLGGRQPGDRCLYVSTGGFSKDARYEAERSSVPITLITLPDLRRLLIEHYDRIGPNGTALVPLERVYWPA